MMSDLENSSFKSSESSKRNIVKHIFEFEEETQKPTIDLDKNAHLKGLTSENIDDMLDSALDHAKFSYPNDKKLQYIYVKEYMEGSEALTKEENILLNRAKMKKATEHVLDKMLSFAQKLYPNDKEIQSIYVKKYTKGSETLTKEENILLNRAEKERNVRRMENIRNYGR